MKINKENVVEAYNVADENGKKMLEASLPELRNSRRNR